MSFYDHVKMLAAQLNEKDKSRLIDYLEVREPTKVGDKETLDMFNTHFAVVSKKARNSGEVIFGEKNSFVFGPFNTLSEALDYTSPEPGDWAVQIEPPVVLAVWGVEGWEGTGASG